MTAETRPATTDEQQARAARERLISTLHPRVRTFVLAADRHCRRPTTRTLEALRAGLDAYLEELES
jgi:hypothetical protein